jgi:hypothetical protein
MKQYKCENCSFRKKYDNNRTSLIGKLWKWHTGWCPGWKDYINSLPEDKKNELLLKYK